MINEELVNELIRHRNEVQNDFGWNTTLQTALDAAIAALKAEPCGDAVMRILTELGYGDEENGADAEYMSALWDVAEKVKALPSVILKPRLCKDCKWWKDSDGVYRRGIEAETPCPINRKAVFEGNGYCYLFEKAEGESK